MRGEIGEMDWGQGDYIQDLKINILGSTPEFFFNVNQALIEFDPLLPQVSHYRFSHFFFLKED